MKKIAVYTAIFGDYDQLMTPLVKSANCDYICLTDSADLKSDFWDVRLLSDETLDAARLSRKPKILPHLFFADYEASLYVDANLLIVGDLEAYIEQYSLTSPMLCVKHGERDCIYEELQACIEGQRDDREVMTRQIEGYRTEGLPAHFGLTVGSFIFRRHNDPSVIELMELWWQELATGSKRDQLSLSYCFWKKRFKYDLYYGNNWNNDYFIWLPHHILNNPFLAKTSEFQRQLAIDPANRLQATSARSLDRRALMPAKFYIDQGQGMAESNVIFAPPSIVNGKNVYQLTLPAGTVSLRFDPIEGDPCLVTNITVTTDQGPRQLRNVNGRSLGNVDVFTTTDPMYLLDPCTGVRQLQISLNLTVVTDTLIQQLMKLA